MLLMSASMELREFLKLASKRERAEVAAACNHSVSYLYQIAGSHRFASPFMATQIEHFTRVVAEASEGRLTAVNRASMVRHPEIFYNVDSLREQSDPGGNDDQA
jgi:hypothetical protein